MSLFASAHPIDIDLHSIPVNAIFRSLTPLCSVGFISAHASISSFFTPFPSRPLQIIIQERDNFLLLNSYLNEMKVAQADRRRRAVWDYEGYHDRVKRGNEDIKAFFGRSEMWIRPFFWRSLVSLYYIIDISPPFFWTDIFPLRY